MWGRFTSLNVCKCRASSGECSTHVCVCGECSTHVCVSGECSTHVCVCGSFPFAVGICAGGNQREKARAKNLAAKGGQKEKDSLKNKVLFRDKAKHGTGREGQVSWQTEYDWHHNIRGRLPCHFFQFLLCGRLTV